MNSDGYDKSSIKSIALHGRLLYKKTLAQLVALPESVRSNEDKRNKGNLGKLVEKFHFRHEPPNDDAPDFAEAGLELKVTGVLQIQGAHDSGKFKAKERLVLKNINFNKIQSETWEVSSIKYKCQRMLLLFYQFDKGPVIDLVFKPEPIVTVFNGTAIDQDDLENAGIQFFEIPEEDVAQMRRDWELIRTKISDNQAHNLSEGDTKYLKACRKGSGGANERLQSYVSVTKPEGEKLAPTRAFSLPASYVTSLIKSQTEKLPSMGVSVESSFEHALQLRLAPFIGATSREIASKLSMHFNPKDKGLNARLITRILSKGGSSVLELEKAGIKPKTIVVDERLIPAESMSFSAFDYCEIVEQEFEDSQFLDDIESTFLFVVFHRRQDGERVLQRAFYWTMPTADVNEAELVWNKTKELIKLGEYEGLPKSKDNYVAHVRTHAQDSSDVARTPQGGFQVKRSFWLNRLYIAEVVQNAFLAN